MIVAGAARRQSRGRRTLDRFVLAVPVVRHRAAGYVLQPGARGSARKRSRSRNASGHHKAQKR